MRLLWYSNAPWVPSGYGQQTALFAQRLQALGHHVAIASFHGLHGHPMEWHGIPVYPGSAEDIWAQDILLGHYQRHEADLAITLMDQWVLDAGKLNEMRANGMRVAHWTPVDCEPLGQLDRRNLTLTGNQPIAISRFGEKQLAEFGPLYVPHGTDTSVFRPRPEFREQARAKAALDKTFLIGINAANHDPVRKGFGEQFAAFRLLHEKYPSTRLLIHARRQSRAGSDLDRLTQILHLEDAVEFGNQYSTVTGLTTPEELANWYNVLDLFSNCAYGEGFGIPVVEAQACGTPVAVTDCSSLAELCGAGWKADGDWYWNAGHGAWWTHPFIRAIYDAYERAYILWEERAMEPLRARAREFALSYDADLVTEQFWKPALDKLDLGKPTGVAVAPLESVSLSPKVNSLDDTALLITAWKRPDYLAAVLDSWATARRVRQLRKVVVALAPSALEAEQRALIAAFGERTGHDVEIRMDSPECASVPGPHRAIAEAANAIFGADEGCRFLILSEEDIQVSSDVLDFMLWGRRKAAGRALAVCAHNALGSGWQRGAPDDSDAGQSTARLLRSFSPWCWGTWREVWEKVLEPDWDYDCNRGPRADQHGYDWQLQRIVTREAPVLVPDASRSQNIGRQGGVYANPDDFDWTQARSFREKRPAMSYVLEEDASGQPE